MAKTSRHPWDEVSDELLTWLTEEPEYYVEALRSGHQTPFSADVSEQDKLDYYRRQVFMQNPDGSINFDEPNGEGRDMLIKRVGIDGYAQIMSQVMPKAGMRAMPGQHMMPGGSIMDDEEMGESMPDDEEQEPY